MRMDDIITSVSGEKISVADVCLKLKVDGVFRKAIYQLIEEKLIRNAIDALNISVSDPEKEKWLHHQRQCIGVRTEEQMLNHSRYLGVEKEQWNSVAEIGLLTEKLKQYMFDRQKITEFFQQNKNKWREVSLSRIVLATKDEIEQLLERIKTTDSDFATEAENSLEVSVHKTGGFIGTFRSENLNAQVAKAVFTAQLGDVVGSFFENGYWSAYKIEGYKEQKLDDNLCKRIQNELFSSWLAEAVANSKP